MRFVGSRGSAGRLSDRQGECAGAAQIALSNRKAARLSRSNVPSQCLVSFSVDTEYVARVAMTGSARVIGVAYG